MSSWLALEGTFAALGFTLVNGVTNYSYALPL